MRTQSTIPITFDGLDILTPGGLYDGEEINLPLEYSTEAVQGINRDAPALYARGNVSGSFDVTTSRDFVAAAEALAEFAAQLRTWRSKGVGILTIDGMRFEAVLTSFRPRLSRACTRLSLEYSFTVGRELTDSTGGGSTTLPDGYIPIG